LSISSDYEMEGDDDEKKCIVPCLHASGFCGRK
jgi:hypothetical protein